MKPICFVEIDSINDLARFACALERVAMPVYYLTESNMLAVQSEPINEKLVYYYVKSNSYNEFLAYKIVGCKEDVKMASSMAEPSYTYTPIIAIKELPNELMKDDSKGCKRVILNDLNSLAKLCSYKSMIDESPMPLFYFSNNLGAFLSLDDTDTYFYCIEEEPTANFLKYSMTLSKASFTNKVEEHGYTYTKIIRLKEHPLVEV